MSHSFDAVIVGAGGAGLRAALELGQVGSVLCNPVDISQRAGNTQALRRTMELIAADPQVDIIVIHENADILSRFLGKEMAHELNGIIIDFGHKQSKPVVVVLPPGSLEMERLEIECRLAEAGIAVYPSMDRAARAIGNVSRYFRFSARTKGAKK